MKRFRFTLQAVRELREAEEQSAQQAFAAAVRACDEAAQRVATLERELQSVWNGIRHSSTQGIRSDELRDAHGWCLVLEARQKTLATEWEACQRQVEATQSALQRATCRREALDRIFRKRRAEHAREIQAEEQKFLDEIATRGAWHGSRWEAA